MQTQNKPNMQSSKKDHRKSKNQRPAPRPDPREGKHQPFASLLEEQNKQEAEEKAKKQAARAAEEARKLEEEERAKHAVVYDYADDVKARHPSLPEDLFKQIKSSETAGAAKKLVREWLRTNSPI